MRFICSFLLTAALYLCTLVAASAQEDDKGFLTRKIQEALSGGGRFVSIDGFRGALSSEASFDRMTIADDDGIWLTLENVVLDWNRSALLRGRVEVESLTAERLDLPRLPVAEPDALPEAEAAPFRLPELPVSIRIETFSIGQIALGAPILGEEAALTVTASAQLNDDLGKVDLEASRTDGKQGDFEIKANFERDDTILDVLLRLSEGENGIAARLLNLPGTPSVDMTVAGKGPVDEFTADVQVTTDGQERLAGEVVLSAQTPQRASDKPDRRIQADIGGDITALLAPRYREFFGEDVALKIDALVQGNGAIEVSDFALQAQAANLAGKVTLNAAKWPTLIDISGRVANPDGTPILLPLGGEGATVETVDLRVDYDAADGEAITASFDMATLSLQDMEIARSKLGLEGKLQSDAGRVGQFDGDIIFDVAGLSPRDAALAEALGSLIKGRATIRYVEDQPLSISGLDLSGTDYGLTGNVVVGGIETGLLSQVDALLEAGDLSRFSALAGRELDGQTQLALKGEVGLLSGQFDLQAAGSTTDLALGIEQADAVLAGRTDLTLTVKRTEAGTLLRNVVLENDALSLTGAATLRTKDSSAGAKFLLKDISLVVPQYDGPVQVSAIASQDSRGWTVDAQTDGPYGAALTASGLVTGPNATLTFSADLPNVKPFADQIEGPLRAEGTLRNTDEGWQITTDATGPYQTHAAIEGLVAPEIDLRFDLSMPDLGPVVPQLKGPLRAAGRLQQTDNGFVVDTQVSGPYGARAAIEGLATGPKMQLSFDVSVPNVAPLAPGVSGPLAASGVIRQTSQGLQVETNASGPYSSRARVNGVVTGPQANVQFDLSMPNIGALVDKINGPLTVEGSARRQGDAWAVQTDARGPAGTQAQVAGTVAANGRLNLDVTGNAPLGLAGPFLGPRDLQGQARFDLSINGPAALSSVTGDIQTSDATLSAPNLRVALEGINADIRLANNRAQINVTGQSVNGGNLRVGGSVVLTGALSADLAIAIENLVLIDPKLYRTSLNGALRLAGPLTGAAQISGRVDVGETEVSVPSTGITSIGDIPPINHIGATRPVIATRRKAGIEDAAAGADPARDRGVGLGLNVRVNAPSRIFVRGRGLDAELGGALTLTGTTNRIISAGRFDLLRGRLDILGKRFDLVEGAIQFQGDLVPYIRFVSSTTTATGEVRVVVQGPADAPEVTFEATPEAPQDEVLAQLLFGRNLSEISPIQALQLANAVATLAGRGGTGVIANLRSNFGLDDLDVTTTDSGATAVRAGKYISENIYTDVTAASDGTGEVSLNLDITTHLKGKATLGSDGNSGIGIFFEKDY
ncbi:translocation/assembly module TamB domain-containing protein [Sulfitobacter sp. F26204]|uniref:translocation/assembly module TamB domain-containing protein n=1 Tax=Sulfitobacter sp. F26204 TaxID=2996014 RepID=UPI00225E5F84|nr:translocation/assembly module TamB domain-containing protein [Sulfitobacter sp. F26204]MCX7560756.1 translocation/assembly module TamB domain-containing protein [Sulfitobacter sp. F26204]